MVGREVRFAFHTIDHDMFDVLAFGNHEFDMGREGRPARTDHTHVLDEVDDFLRTQGFIGLFGPLGKLLSGLHGDDEGIARNTVGQRDLPEFLDCACKRCVDVGRDETGRFAYFFACDDGVALLFEWNCWSSQMLRQRNNEFGGHRHGFDGAC
ncbi:hypothetical protein SDC9_151912 [bioreactor metagenome]|uniref:Uncharacterized protein n=1 Tax=bioreactor metagenome TaxID=1076179 RepID=A0A645ES65_9ZZZZ